LKHSILPVVVWLCLATNGRGQQITTSEFPSVNEPSSLGSLGYTVQGTTPERERLLRAQIQVMQPAVLPARIIFVPHWQYVYATRMYHLHVPTGMTSKMFTHLPSRSVYIDADLYGGNDWLGHWIAHELGHLATNSVKETDAERAAHEYRKRIAFKSETPSKVSPQMRGMRGTSSVTWLLSAVPKIETIHNSSEPFAGSGQRIESTRKVF
jgi:hypothetical protein